MEQTNVFKSECTKTVRDCMTTIRKQWTYSAKFNQFKPAHILTIYVATACAYVCSKELIFPPIFSQVYKLTESQDAPTKILCAFLVSLMSYMSNRSYHTLFSYPVNLFISGNAGNESVKQSLPTPTLSPIHTHTHTHTRARAREQKTTATTTGKSRPRRPAILTDGFPQSLQAMPG
jgi:hypothetical protein